MRIRRWQRDHPSDVDRPVEGNACRGQRLGENGGHPSRVGKADLGLGGVHVHVHFALAGTVMWRYASASLAPDGPRSARLIAPISRRSRTTLPLTAITISLAPLGGKQKAGNGQTPGAMADGTGFAGASRTHQVGEALSGLANGRQLEQGAAAVLEVERHPGVSEREAGKGADGVAQLGRLGAEELAPRRQIGRTARAP